MWRIDVESEQTSIRSEIMCGKGDGRGSGIYTIDESPAKICFPDDNCDEYGHIGQALGSH